MDAGARELVMTGGEPTLVKELPRHIAQASEGGIRRIVLQTNAMRLANEDFTQRLVDSGLTSTVISLHSHRDDVLESITTLPNTMDRILRGIRKNTARIMISDGAWQDRLARLLPTSYVGVVGMVMRARGIEPR